jgi:hypothetical protein
LAAKKSHTSNKWVRFDGGRSSRAV